MGWAETLTINSNPTLPLDELFRGSIRLKSSETDVYKIIDTTPYHGEQTNNDASVHTAMSQKLKFNCDGTALLYFDTDIAIINVSSGLSSDYYEFNLSLLKNGEVVHTQAANVYAPSNNGISTEKIIIYNYEMGFSTNDEYELEIKYNIVKNQETERLYRCTITPIAKIKAMPYIGGFNLIEEVNN